MTRLLATRWREPYGPGAVAGPRPVTPRGARPLWVLLLILGLPVLVPSRAVAVGTLERESGRLRVLIFGGDGAPLPGQRVTVDDPEHARKAASAVTDENGAAHFTLPAGTYVLAIGGTETVGTFTPPIPVPAGGSTEVLITVPDHGGAPRVAVESGGASARGVRRAAGGDSGSRGRIAGRLVDPEGQPVAGARIFVRGSDAEAESDAEGKFVLSLPPGRYELTIVHSEYGTQTEAGIVVQPNRRTERVLTLEPTASALPVFTVLAPRIEGSTTALLEERKAASAVTETLGAEEMAQAGDSDASSALKRVTGVTLVGGKYVYVRGLGERYSSTLLNGATLPSPEPEKRAVPLDMFPTDVLDSIVVHKTYAPNLPGEFGGGTVVLRTRTVPRTRVATFSASLGALAGTTFQSGLSYQGGPTDFLGFGAAYRALPREIEEATQDQKLAEGDLFGGGFTAEELEALGERFPNRWNTTRRPLPPAVGLSGTVGTPLELGGMEAGVLASLNYGLDAQRLDKDATYYTVAGEEVVPQNVYTFEESEKKVTLAGLLTAGLKLSEDESLHATFLLDRISDDEVRVYEGYNDDLNGNLRITRLKWVERTLGLLHLGGDHRLPFLDTRLEWHYAGSLSTRVEPDRREYRYDYEEASGRWRISDRPEGNQRLFSDLLDQNHDLGADATVPLPSLGERATLQVGLSAIFKARGVQTRRFKFEHQGPKSYDPSIISQDPEQIFVPENIDRDGFQLLETTRNTDNYSGTKDIQAAYLMATLPVVEALELMAGLRLERFHQITETFPLFQPEAEPERSVIETFDPLPAATLTYRAGETLLLRAAVGRSVNRPNFFEASDVLQSPVTGGFDLKGNPEVKPATLLHGDLRVEWYPDAGESMSLAVFGKTFYDPIETTVLPTAQPTVTFANADSALVAGVEIEVRRHLGFAHPALRDFYVSGNATFVHSRVTLPDSGTFVQTSRDRPLQGQSPWAVNLQIGYDAPESGVRGSIVFHAFGPRIAQVGAFGLPDTYEEPVPLLDAVASVPIGGGFTLGVKGRNLLDSPVVYTVGGKVAMRYRRGRGISLSVNKTF